MKKTLLAGSVALALCSASNVTAATFEIAISEMEFGGIIQAFGTISDTDGIAVGTIIDNQNLSSPLWHATAVTVFDTAGTHNWSDTGGVIFPGVGTFPDPNNNDVWVESFSYDFTLADGEAAFGLSFDWGTNYDIPVLAIFSCDENNACRGEALPLVTGPFPDQTPAWNGTLTSGSMPSAIPVPAAVWLFGSGLIGLASIARRRKV